MGFCNMKLCRVLKSPPLPRFIRIHISPCTHSWHPPPPIPMSPSLSMTSAQAHDELMNPPFCLACSAGSPYMPWPPAPCLLPSSPCPTLTALNSYNSQANLRHTVLLLGFWETWQRILIPAPKNPRTVLQQNSCTCLCCNTAGPWFTTGLLHSW